MRPSSLADVVGHRELICANGPLARAIAADRLPSVILWGPPGAGKTTLAQVIAASTRATFVAFSAVLGGVAEVRVIVEHARERRAIGAGRTILFVDEIHRFNKAQQDAFLPHVEDGTVTLIGATTENPSFALNAPLLSRCTVFRLEAIDKEDLVQMMRRALAHPEGLGGRLAVDEDALFAIAELARGDGRRSLNLLEVASEQAERAGLPSVDVAQVAAVAGHRTLLYDKAGEEHHNVTSAFIKSMRGSDPDAAVYWMMRMVEAGDDPLFILRRMIIFASEDVGNADPRALPLAVATAQAVQEIGMPEGRIPLAQCVTYLALAPKSNAAYAAGDAARAAVREHGTRVPPDHLRDGSHSGARQLGRGVGYRYPHAEGGFAAGQRHLPEELAHLRFYEPSALGFEARLGEILAELRALREGDA